MADPNDKDEQSVIVDLIDDAMVSDSDPPRRYA
jgi:hypothetical protein